MKVSANGRYLVDEAGQPFFYLADTAWRLFYETDRQEAEEYLINRKRKGFSVIMPVLLAEANGQERRTNRFGFLPLIDQDPAKPNESFFEHVDAIVRMAGQLGLYLAILPTWAEFVGPLKWGKGPILFDQAKAYAYGLFLGKRYGREKIIWVLGGDRQPEGEGIVEIWRSMAAGLKAGDQGRCLMTFHPSPDFEQDRVSSADWLHDEPWLDFNMMQTSTRWDFPNDRYIRRDYARQPVKPTLDGETHYEYSHEFFWEKPGGGRRISAHQVRKAAYNPMLSGAMGHTYGCRDVWSFYKPELSVPPDRDVTLSWRQAMDLPGAYQMGTMKQLFHDYPWYQLEPGHEERLLVHDRQQLGIHVPVARSQSGDHVLLYVPENMAVRVRTGQLGWTKVTASWFNPRDGHYQYIGTSLNQDIQEFQPPQTDRNPDAVLILEKA